MLPIERCVSDRFLELEEIRLDKISRFIRICEFILKSINQTVTMSAPGDTKSNYISVLVSPQIRQGDSGQFNA